jgi:hypothetical protein
VARAYPWLEQGAVTSWCGWAAGLRGTDRKRRDRVWDVPRNTPTVRLASERFSVGGGKGKKPRATPAYPVLFEPEPEVGFTVTFPEAGIAATYDPNWDAARAQAEDMLEEAILGMIAHGGDVPWPASVSKGGLLRLLIHLPAPTAAKLEIYRAMRTEGLGAEQLAQRLGWQPAQVRRLFGRAARTRSHRSDVAGARAPACCPTESRDPAKHRCSWLASFVPVKIQQHGNSGARAYPRARKPGT